jgi:hypothetical protein
MMEMQSKASPPITPPTIAGTLVVAETGPTGVLLCEACIIEEAEFGKALVGEDVARDDVICGRLVITAENVVPALELEVIWIEDDGMEEVDLGAGELVEVIAVEASSEVGAANKCSVFPVAPHAI